MTATNPMIEGTTVWRGEAFADAGDIEVDLSSEQHGALVALAERIRAQGCSFDSMTAREEPFRSLPRP